MRSLLLLLIIMMVTPAALLLPHLGVLVWTWLSIMNPHRLSWGFTYDMPFVLIIASVTLVAWFLSREPKLPASTTLMWLALLFSVHFTITTLVALHPEISWPLWNRNIKTMVLFFIAATLINSRIRIQAMLWTIAVSLGYFGAAGVVATLSSGGRNILAGPPGTMISDNNHIALTLAMLLPVLNYLRTSSANKFVQLTVVMVMGFCLVAVISSYSRGSLIAIAAGGLAFLWRSKKKVVIGTFFVVVGLVTVSLMPSQWEERVETLNSVESVREDGSFSGRVDAWYVSWRIAKDRPLTGAGFSGVEGTIFSKYMPDSGRITGTAAHSIYFQILGDHGFVGLLIYLSMMGCAWLHLRRVSKRTRLHPHSWAHEMASMLEVSLVIFCVGGAALSVAYHDFILIIMVISMNLDLITARLADKETSEFIAEDHIYRPQIQ